MQWTPDRIDDLRSLIAAGRSARQAGVAMGVSNRAITNAAQRYNIPLNPMGVEWTPERLEILRARAGNMSAARIADELGCGISRNAVIGAACRNGIRLNLDRDANSPSKPRAPRRPSGTLKLVPPSAPPQPPAEAISLMDLTNETCRWPEGDRAPFLFCGTEDADFRSGVPYCRVHRRIAYRRPGEAV